MSFALAAAILGAFSPLIGFSGLERAAACQPRMHAGAYSFIMLTHVAVIAFAGIAANLRLLNCSGSLAEARVGAGASCSRGWRVICFSAASFPGFCGHSSVARPCRCISSRDHPLQGNFYEAVFRSCVLIC